MAAKKLQKLSFTPTAGNIIIKAIEADQKTTGGIYLPDSASEKPLIGEVVAVGPDEVTEHGTTRKAPVKPHDKVIYKKWGGNEVEISGDELLIIRFEDVLAVGK